VEPAGVRTGGDIPVKIIHIIRSFILRVSRSIPAITLVMVMGICRSSGGDSTEFELFFPVPTPEGGVMTESARMLPGKWTAGTYVQLEKDPLVLTDSAGTTVVDRAVYFRTQVHALLSYNLFNLAQVSADLPVTLLADQKLDGIMQPHLTYLNDFSIRIRLPLDRYGPFHLGISSFVNIATGNAEKFGGTDGPLAQPGALLLAEYDAYPWFVRMNLGYAERDRTEMAEYSLVLDDRLLYRAAAGMRLRRTALFTELAGSNQLDRLFASAQHDAKEWFLGIQSRWGNFVFSPAFGIGLTNAFGVPAWRGVCSLFYIPEVKGASRFVRRDSPGFFPHSMKENLPSKGTLVVNVVDEHYRPVEGCRVVWREGTMEYEASTDFRGELSIKGYPGVLVLRVEREGYQSEIVTGTIASGMTGNLEVVLRLDHSVPERGSQGAGIGSGDGQSS